jgi:hypothetical protein
MLRDRQFNLRLSKEERAKLERLAEFYGLSRGNVLRMLLKQESDKQALFGRKKRTR